LLWRGYEKRRSGADVRPYRLGAVLTVVVTGAAFFMYVGFVGSAQDEAESNPETVLVTLRGTLSGENKFIGPWTVLPQAMVESSPSYTTVVVWKWTRQGRVSSSR
jgi:hypothetical protein